jgi:hypothetical protein
MYQRQWIRHVVSGFEHEGRTAISLLRAVEMACQHAISLCKKDALDSDEEAAYLCVVLPTMKAADALLASWKYPCILTEPQTRTIVVVEHEIACKA